MSILTLISIVGSACFLCTVTSRNDETLLTRVKNGLQISLDTAIETRQLVTSLQAVLLIIVYLYTGIVQSFFMVIYGTCVGQTLYFGKDAKWLAGVSGIFLGAGQVSAAVFRLAFSALYLAKKPTAKCLQLFYVIVGFNLFSIAMLLIFLYLPDESPNMATNEVSFLEPNKFVALLSSFLLGFSDCFFQTEVFNYIGAAFTASTPSAMAMFSFFQAVGGTFVFLYTYYFQFSLRAQVFIMEALSLSSLIVFFINNYLRSNTEASPDAVDIPAFNKSELSSINVKSRSQLDLETVA